MTVTYRNVQRWPVAGATSLRCHCGVFSPDGDWAQAWGDLGGGWAVLPRGPLLPGTWEGQP